MRTFSDHFSENAQPHKLFWKMKNNFLKLILIIIFSEFLIHRCKFNNTLPGQKKVAVWI